MSKTLMTLMLVIGLLVLVGLGACSRDITTVQQDAGASNCFNCHTDDVATDQYGLLDKQLEWNYSNHATGEAAMSYAGGRASCAGCHSGSGFQERMVQGTGIGSLEGDAPYIESIGCWTCHAPHTNGNFELRITEPQILTTGVSMDLGASNICTACHIGRHSVEEDVPSDAATASITSTHWGAHHGPQGDIFEGTNGYEYAGVTYRRDVPPAHNTDQTRCFGCHGNDNPAVDLGGHSFIQTNEAGDDNVASCNRCHSDMTDFNYNDVQTEVADLLTELEGLLQDRGILDETGSIPEGTSSDNPIVDTPDVIGAAWNYILVEEDRSEGVHNPDYVRDLLQASIDNLNGK